LKQKVGPADAGALKNKMLEYVKTLNLKDLAKDVEPFLFQPSDSKKIVLFSEYIKQVAL